MDDEILDFYRSVSGLDDRETIREFLGIALNDGIYPESVRYGIFKNVYRGVIRDRTGDCFYFQKSPENPFHIVKATTPEKKLELDRLHKNCTLGCDLIRSETAELEDEKKATPGGAGPLPPPSVSEEEDVRTQDEQVTTRHPGGTVAYTPQQDGSSEKWHGALQRSQDTTNVLKSLNAHLKSLPAPFAPVDPKMKQFMVEVMGKTPREVDTGRVRLNGMQRAQYNAWLTKSADDRLASLNNWLQKRRG